MSRGLCGLILLSLLSACALTPARLKTFACNGETHRLEPGVFYRCRDLGGAHRLHSLQIDLPETRHQLALSAPEIMGRDTAAHAAHHQALLAINASFFDKQFSPRGPTSSFGRPWSPTLPAKSHPVFLCTQNDVCRIEHRAGNDPLPGTLVVSGFHSLVKAGIARTPEEDSACGAFCTTTHPRTAVGLNEAHDTVFFYVADGRKKAIAGLSLQQLSAVMHSDGVHEGINLDGGGSSLLVWRGQVLSERPDNEPALRAVANSVLLLPRDIASKN